MRYKMILAKKLQDAAMEKSEKINKNVSGPKYAQLNSNKQFSPMKLYTFTFRSNLRNPDDLPMKRM